MSKILPMREDRVCCGSLFKIVYAASAANVDFFLFFCRRGCRLSTSIITIFNCIPPSPPQHTSVSSFYFFFCRIIAVEAGGTDSRKCFTHSTRPACKIQHLAVSFLTCKKVEVIKRKGNIKTPFPLRQTYRYMPPCLGVHL